MAHSPSPFFTQERILNAVSLLLIAATIVVLWNSSWEKRDFVEYWSAAQAALKGGNPYDPATMLSIQQSVGRGETLPLMMWNPPQCLAIFLPIAHLSLWTAGNLWLVANGFFVMLTYFVLRGTRTMSPTPLLMNSFPLLLAVLLGQISLLLCFASALAISALHRRRFIQAGVATSILALKPHLFLPLLAYLVWFSFRERSLKIGLGFIAGLSAMTLAIFFAYPGALDHYVSLNASQLQGVVFPWQWNPGVFSGFLRVGESYLIGSNVSFGHYPIVQIICPALALIISMLVVLRNPQKQPLQMAPLLLVLGLLGAPFGWTFDFSALLVVYVIAEPLNRVASTRSERLVLLCNLTLLAITAMASLDYVWLWWVPLLALPSAVAIYLSGAERLNSVRNTES